MDYINLRDNQGNDLIEFSGFTYIKQIQYNQSKKYARWNCAEKDKCCKALLTFDSDKKTLKLMIGHNHPPHSRTGKDHIVLDETESEAHTNPLNDGETVHTDSSENNFNFILTSCTHSECQKQSNVTRNLFPKSVGKEINEMQVNDAFSGIDNMSQPCSSSAMCKALQNKSKKKLPAACVVKLQSLHSVPQNRFGAICIEWITHRMNLKTLFPALLIDERNVDVILASEGQSIKCHKLMLTSSSVYFEKLLNETVLDYCFPIVAFTEWHFWQLKALVEYLYCGKLTVSNKKLLDFFSFVETLQIKGLQSWSNQTCVLSKNTRSIKQNFQCNRVIEDRLNSSKNTIEEQTEINQTSIECQKRKHDSIESDDNIKAEGVNTKFARFVEFCSRHSDE